jgi:hypothetical protein
MKEHQHWCHGRKKKSFESFINITNIPWLDKITGSDSKSNISWVFIWPLTYLTQEAEGDQPVISVGHKLAKVNPAPMLVPWPFWMSPLSGHIKPKKC